MRTIIFWSFIIGAVLLVGSLVRDWKTFNKGQKQSLLFSGAMCLLVLSVMSAYTTKMIVWPWVPFKWGW